MFRRIVAHIDLDAVRANYARACALAPSSKTIAVIKANAYGHGMPQVAEALSDVAAAFAVATVEEAVELRLAGISNELLVLQGANGADARDVAREHDLTLMVHTREQVGLLEGTGLPAWVKVDTGMHRLGIGPGELGDVLAELQRVGTEVRTVCTHLACADELDNDETGRQLAAFRDCTAGLEIPLSIANTAALLCWPDSHAEWNRPGYMLYGLSPLAGEVDGAAGLEPAMSFLSEVIAIRDVPAGGSVGYGGRWTASRPSRIATVAAGYGDGYPRHAPDGTPVFVHGATAPLAGVVSMDMITLDVTDRPEVAVGDRVELWGRNLSVNEVAAHAGTIGYELLTGVSVRVPRRYA
jgi:alanine racemase